MRSKPSLLLLAFCLLSSSLVLLSNAWAAPQRPVQDEPLEITSDRLEADDRNHTVLFVGEVVAKQADLVIYAEQMTIYYQAKTRAIERIVAERDVRIVQGARVATGQMADYDRTKGEIALTGNPQVHQGQDTVSGDKITVFLNEDKSVVSSQGPSRVNALFHPRSEKP